MTHLQLDSRTANECHRKYFSVSNRMVPIHFRKCGLVHFRGSVVPDVQEHAAKSAVPFLRTRNIVSRRDASDGRQDSIEMPDDLTHRNVFGIARQNEPANPSRDALHDTVRLEVQHDVLQETSRNIIFLGELADGDRTLAVVFDQRH